MKTRFSDIKQKALSGVTLVPSVLMDDLIPHATVNSLKDHYKEDLVSISSFESEFHLWKCKWRSFSQPLPDSPAIS